MQPVLCRWGWNLLKTRQIAKIGTSILSRDVCFHSTRCSFALRLDTGQGGDNSNTAFPLGHALSRHYSSEPPKYWDDVKGLPQIDPERGELVYVGTLAFMVKGVKAFSVSTSVLALGLQPYLLYHSQGHTAGTVLALGTIMGFFIFCTPLLIHFITKKYVTDMYYKADTGVFTATTYNLFVQRKRWTFTPEDVSVPTVPGMFTTIHIKGKPLFVDQSLFRSKQAYIKMMGYDKPLDWEIPNPDKQEEEDKH
ncbi:transmembrane protein 70 homolog, mitochondrial-like [Liolophura sinensis]|uniref:transmembrane protein 70 homolog, mitochondrial-like n=1 Tax=Liolophura sinensis TaxID=3198878 RepID=UPI003158D570